MDTYLRFYDARNHGHSDSWWYPSHNVMAYNVKMHSFGDVKKLRAKLTAKMNDYYSDNFLQEVIDHDLESNCLALMDDIKNDFGLSSHFAGRSGGWIEVEYENPLTEAPSDDEIDYYFDLANKLDNQEAAVKLFIEKRHKALNAYIDSDEYYNDLANYGGLLCDDEIDDIHKEKIAELQAKINAK